MASAGDAVRDNRKAMAGVDIQLRYGSYSRSTLESDHHNMRSRMVRYNLMTDLEDVACRQPSDHPVGHL
jgi:hypothetical protein